jgi:hypothetical protein
LTYLCLWIGPRSGWRDDPITVTLGINAFSSTNVLRTPAIVEIYRAVIATIRKLVSDGASGPPRLACIAFGSAIPA